MTDRVHPLPSRFALPAAAADARLRGPLGAAALIVMAAAGLAIAAGAAAGPSFLVPSSRAGFPDWLGGPLAGLAPELSATGFSVLVLVMCASYGGALACAGAIRPRWALAAIGALHVTFAVAPPILTTDPFGYLDYGRLGALHDLNPYVHGADAAASDPIHPWVVWHDLPSPYGPLFTLPTYALAWLDFEAGLWVIKLTAAAASLGCVALVWRSAERLGRSPLAAAMLVGLNPLLLVWAVGGAHNDLLVALLVALGVERTLAGRAGSAGAAVAGAASVKVAGGLALPFMLLGRADRGRIVLGAAAVAAATSIAAVAVLGAGALDYPGAVADQQALVSEHSVPTYLGDLLGAGGATTGVRLAAGLAFAAAFVALLVWTWRGADWVTSAGWATLALLLTAAWLMPWYIVWLLPLAALGRGRALVAAALALTAFVVATRLPLLFA